MGNEPTWLDTRPAPYRVVGQAGRGIKVDAAGNLVIRNTARGNEVNFDIASGNTSGAMVTSEAAMNASTNSLVNISF